MASVDSMSTEERSRYQSSKTTAPKMDDFNTEAAPPSEQIRLQLEWNKRMGVVHNPVRYDKTAVLLIYWDPADDDLETGKEVRRLRDVLKDEYDFIVEEAVLSSKRSPQKQAKSLLSDFVNRQDDPNTLLLVYYAGHGYSTVENASGNIKLIGNLRQDEKDSIDWRTVEWALGEAEADILIIFDCCHAGLLCEPYERSRTEVCFQVLAACERNRTTRKAGANSFTSALIWALKQLKLRRSFSTLELKTMIRNYKDFPHDQIPQLSFRIGNSRPECIYMARMLQTEQQLPTLIDEDRHQEYLDIRLHFSEELSYPKILETCDALKNLKARDSTFARKISLIGKNRMPPHIERAAKMLAEQYRRRKHARESGRASEPWILQQGSTMASMVREPMKPQRDTLPSAQHHSYKDSDASTLYPREDEAAPLLPKATLSETSMSGREGVGYHFRMLVKGLSDMVVSIFRRLVSREDRSSRNTSPLPF